MKNAMSSDTAIGPSSRFLTVADVAIRLGVSPKHIRRVIARGDLPAHRFGRAVRIACADLEQFISRYRS